MVKKTKRMSRKFMMQPEILSPEELRRRRLARFDINQAQPHVPVIQEEKKDEEEEEDEDEEPWCCLCMGNELVRDDNGRITNGIMCEGADGLGPPDDERQRAPHFTCDECVCRYIREQFQPHDGITELEQLRIFCEEKQRIFQCVFHTNVGGVNGQLFRCSGIYPDVNALRQIASGGGNIANVECALTAQNMDPDRLCDERRDQLNAEIARQAQEAADAVVAREREERERATREEQERQNAERVAREAAERAAREINEQRRQQAERQRLVALRDAEIVQARQNVREITQTLQRRPNLIFQCPRCEAPIADWEGCSSFQCPSCEQYFCALCSQVSNNSPQSHQDVINCRYRGDPVPNRTWWPPIAVFSDARLRYSQEQFDQFLNAIQNENIRNAVIIILINELRSEFQRLSYHRHDGNRNARASSCTTGFQYRTGINILPELQQRLLREFGKDFLSLLRTGDGVCVPDSWYNFLTYPEPQRSVVVNQMVEDYNYSKQHNGNIFRPEVPPIDRVRPEQPLRAEQAEQHLRAEQPVQPGMFRQAFNYVSGRILNLFGRRGQEEAARAAIRYQPHEHPLDREVIPAVNFELNMVCDSCNRINQPGYIGCSQRCNYHECLECAIAHNHITYQEATEQLERLYNYVPDEPEQNILEDEELQGQIMAIAEQQRAEAERRLGLDLQIARQLQDVDGEIRNIPGRFEVPRDDGDDGYDGDEELQRQIMAIAEQQRAEAERRIGLDRQIARRLQDELDGEIRNIPERFQVIRDYRDDGDEKEYDVPNPQPPPHVQEYRAPPPPPAQAYRAPKRRLHAPQVEPPRGVEAQPAALGDNVQFGYYRHRLQGSNVHGVILGSSRDNSSYILEHADGSRVEVPKHLVTTPVLLPLVLRADFAWARPPPAQAYRAPPPPAERNIFAPPRFNRVGRIMFFGTNNIEYCGYGCGPDGAQCSHCMVSTTRHWRNPDM